MKASVEHSLAAKKPPYVPVSARAIAFSFVGTAEPKMASCQLAVIR